ncbi:MAG TPA: efflux RND transporter periplasmic adaptor subunit [Acidobacteriota bacterium]|nr:efflux RND transporter periplasmic adaptor subunit [Acidobacteriota bacterium]
MITSTKKAPLLALLALFSACEGPAGEGSGEAAAEHSSSHEDHHHDEHDGGARVLALDPEVVSQAGIQVELSRTEVMSQVVVATAEARPDPSGVAHIRPLAEGVVKKVLVNQGERVRRGQTLVVYDNVELGMLLGVYRSRRADLRQASARREVADKHLSRSKELLESQAIAEREFDLRRAGQVEAQEAERRARFALQEIEVRLARLGYSADDLVRLAESSRAPPPEAAWTPIQAPLDGTVTGFDVSVGEVVSPQRVLMTVTDLSRVWVLADVFERDLGAVRGARTALVRFNAYPERVFPARITYQGDVLDSATRTAKFRCVVDNPQRLIKLGMFARVEIPSERQGQAVTVPSNAVHRIGEQAVVFVEQSQGRFVARKIVVLGEQAGRTGIAEGLQEGESVVTSGSFALKSELLREQLGGGHAH